eukprot:4474303-Pleurochrysis_carterae.AAC.1
MVRHVGVGVGVGGRTARRQLHHSAAHDQVERRHQRARGDEAVVRRVQLRHQRLRMPRAPSARTLARSRAGSRGIALGLQLPCPRKQKGERSLEASMATREREQPPARA